LELLTLNISSLLPFALSLQDSNPTVLLYHLVFLFSFWKNDEDRSYLPRIDRLYFCIRVYQFGRRLLL